jgi:conjugative transposon TraM protein
MTTQPQHSPQFLRKRKMLLVMPLLVLPFVCIVFVALGGGKGEKKNSTTTESGKGFNMNLPGAHFAKKEAVLNKMGFYEKADADSVKLMDRIKQDPYHTKVLGPVTAQHFSQAPLVAGMFGKAAGHFTTTLRSTPAVDSNADKLLKQLDQLKQVLHRPAMPAAFPASIPTAYNPSMLSSQVPDMSRLEKLMQTIKAADTATSDPQLDKISGILDKALRIQHPGQEQGGEKAPAGVQAPSALPVTPPHETATVSDFATNPPVDEDTGYQDADGFYSIDEPDKDAPTIQNTIAAVIPEDQTLVAGATITLRLSQDAVINGITIPRDNPVYGLVSISGDRMSVTVSSIRYRQGIYPVSLQVYDMDGLPGIHIPGAITRDVAKESADQGISSMGLNSLDPSIAGQAATAGIEAAKTLISRKIRLVRVSVKAGYQVLLKNTKVSTH